MTPEEYAAALVAAWPELSDDQLDRIAVLLREPARPQDDDIRPAPLEEAS